MVYYHVIMIKLRLRYSFISLGADNNPKTTILRIVKMVASRQRNYFVPMSFPPSKKQHYSKRCFCISATKAYVHCLNTEVIKHQTVRGCCLFLLSRLFSSCMIVKMLETGRIKKTKILSTSA